MSRVALLFDNSLRPETTGTYCRRALSQLFISKRIAEFEHYLPTDLPRLNREQRRWDLIIAVDDGLDYDLPTDVAPVAWWAIDTHLDFERALRRAKQAQWTFAAQKNGAERLRLQGMNAEWLPLACDPDLHRRQNVPLRFDLSFVGNLFPGERTRLLDLLGEKISNMFIGQKYFSEMMAILSASKLAFNRSLADDINMRVFEVLCSGSLLLTNDLIANGQTELFQDSIHLATYRSDEELLEKVAFYLTHDEVRKKIADAGRSEVLSKHTYLHRMNRLLETVSTDKSKVKSSMGVVNTVNAQKSASYFDFDRPDIQDLVPCTAKRILDIGCGGGRLGVALKERQHCHVTGIELNPTAASLARTRLDDVLIGNLETDRFEFTDGTFDCVICADVLEHLRQPEVVLRKIRRWLVPKGALIVSVPNVRNHTVISSLLAGNWTYESAGLLDADHVRFFTRREIEKLLFRTDFDIDELRMVHGEGASEWLGQGSPRDISLNGIQIRASSSEDAAEFFAYQFLVRAVPQSVRRSLPPARLDLQAGLAQLATRFPWPSQCPTVSIPNQNHGWFADGARDVLMREVTSNMRVIVELGSWLGLSTRFLADRAPLAKIIAIDHWLGSPEHQRKQEWQKVLPQLYEGFLAQCWEYRDRIQPVRLSTREGLQAVADVGLEPDLIFVDADHSYVSVREDLKDCRRLFPQAVLTGDDYDDLGVQQAVHEFVQADGLKLELFGETWRAWKLTAPRTVSRTTRMASSPADSFGVTSIIVVTWNQLPYTQLCLDSLRLRTDEPYELIVVDNGSTDGTVDYLRTLPDIMLIENSGNCGFPAAVNQGLRIARGENLLLLNNDTILTTGWLRRMLDVLNSDRQIGIVGPTSNFVGSDQQIPFDYAQLNDLDGFAWTRYASLVEHHEPFIENTDRVIGFCMLFKREVIEAIGVLDERFGIGCFEDDDFCRRAKQAGYRTVVARHAFIHHFGSVTFRGSGADLQQILRENQRIYDAKWSSEERPSAEEFQKPPTDVDREGQEVGNARHMLERKPRPEFVLARDNDGNLTIEPNAIRLSGCLIVRNNEATIRPCLESLKPWVDELVVVDTGSTDSTPRIAEEMGARVFFWSWRDDFAAARNVSLEHARGEWLFWMDSDDTLPAECGLKLRDLADREHDEQVLGYVMQVHCPGNDPIDVTVVDHVKLFRNRPELQFEFRIHEQILPAIRRAGGEVAFTDIYVVHSGSDRTPEGQAHKLERDFKLLSLELKDRPNHPFVLFNLGMTHADCGQHTEAIRFLQQCLQFSRSDESHVRKAYALLVSSLMQTQRFEDAENVCCEAQDIFPDDPELLFRRAMLQHQQCRLTEAVVTYKSVLSGRCARHFTSIDAGLESFKARHNLALVYEDLGDLSSAAGEWEQITIEQPNYIAGWRGLLDALLKSRRIAEVEQFCVELSQNPNSQLRNLVPYVEGRLCEMQGDIDAALRAFANADLLELEGAHALRQTCRILFEAGRWSNARDSLEQLSERCPDDASVFYNLGIVDWKTGNCERATVAFQRSLKLRPDSLETWRELGVVLEETGRASDAKECWHRVQQLTARSCNQPQISAIV